MHQTAEMTNERQEPSAKFPANAGSTTPVTIYTTPSDARGAKAREWFKAHNIPFSDHNVVADPEALERMIKLSGSRRVPVVQIGDQVIVGFDENQLAASLPEN